MQLSSGCQLLAQDSIYGSDGQQQISEFLRDDVRAGCFPCSEPIQMVLARFSHTGAAYLMVMAWLPLVQRKLGNAPDDDGCPKMTTGPDPFKDSPFCSAMSAVIQMVVVVVARWASPKAVSSLADVPAYGCDGGLSVC